MADGTQQLLQAFDSLANSISSVQIGNAIKGAQAQADAIRNDQNKNDFEKIRAQQSLADSVAGSVLAYGGDAAHAQQARLSLAPNIPDQHLAALESTGKGTVAEAQKAFMDDAAAREQKKLQFENKLKMEAQAAHDATLLEAAGIKANKPAKGLAQGEVKDIRKAQNIGQALTDTINSAGNLSDADVITPEFLSRNKRVFGLLKANATDIIARARTGAAMPESEVKFYNSLLGGPSTGEITVGRLKETMGVIRGQFYNDYKSVIEQGTARGDLETPAGLRLAGLGMRSFGVPKDDELMTYIKSKGNITLPGQQNQPAGSMQQQPGAAPIAPQPASSIPGLTFK